MPKFIYDEKAGLSRRTFLSAGAKIAAVATLALKTSGLAFGSDGLDPPR
ncbi:MAG: hypothetical protein JST04_03750 [Bdellovibrionales bacterium]|nr:hypothetical protein [Bdellovibrionales bacterium]